MQNPQIASSNKLCNETSAHLLDHKESPIHWQPWGKEALKTAQQQDKPILLSIGECACENSQLMAEECFNDQTLANKINETFISIKVDRYQRPDIAALYQSALPLLGEKKSWPVTLFLTPDAQPYWGGTIFRATSQHQTPSFEQAFTFASECYRKDNETVRHNAATLIQLMAPQKPKMAGMKISKDILKNLNQRLNDMIDHQQGGLRGTPKHPHYPLFHGLWYIGKALSEPATQNHTTKLLKTIFQKGIYDHISGGLTRSTTDAAWQIPNHQEKTLYDNALMLELATIVHQKTQDPNLREAINHIIDWANQDLKTDQDAYAALIRPCTASNPTKNNKKQHKSANDKHKANIYLWEKDELTTHLGDEQDLYTKYYVPVSIETSNNQISLNRTEAPILTTEQKQLKNVNDRLLSARNQTAAFIKDPQILTDWNAMMIISLAKASEELDCPDWLAQAKTTYQFIQNTCQQINGELMHTPQGKSAPVPGLLNDYAQMIKASLTLYKTTTDKTYLQDAKIWTKTVNEKFWCNEFGGYFTTSNDRQDIIIRGKSSHDEAIPNANGVMLANLIQLSKTTNNPGYKTQAEEILSAFAPAIAKNIFSHMTVITAAIELIDEETPLNQKA